MSTKWLKECLRVSEDKEECVMMNKTQIMETINTLAKSQGLYCRIKQSIEEMEEEQRNVFLDHLAQQGFNDPIDLVMYFEC